MIQSKSQNILFIWMKTIYMVMQCLNFLQLVNSNELILKILIYMNTAKIVQKILFLKLILNIQKNYVNYILIIR